MQKCEAVSIVGPNEIPPMPPASVTIGDRRGLSLSTHGQAGGRPAIV